MLEKMESVMNDMTAHVPGLRNCKLAKVVECSGTDEWAYAYECDFDEPMSFLGKYMSTPFHFLYIDKFFEPACGEWVANPNLVHSLPRAGEALPREFRLGRFPHSSSVERSFEPL